MKLKKMALVACLSVPTLLTGCGMAPYAAIPFGYAGLVGNMQTDLGGQTLPSSYYLRDDVQYFPAGPEEQLPNLKRALRQYNLEQEANLDDQ
ncbi:hypothetical protein OAF24_01675 [bacterium]|jgi:hypothetical protein|nr:hypothetical protein [bacterium]MDB4679892.1 hypothetical protein [Planctomycetaceae bacterium]